MNKEIATAKAQEVKQTKQRIRLLPCPFCGERAAWGTGEQKQKYGNEQVYCSNCYAMTAPEGTKEEAALLWNDRNDVSTGLLDENNTLREALRPFTNKGQLFIFHRNVEEGNYHECLFCHREHKDWKQIPHDQMSCPIAAAQIALKVGDLAALAAAQE